MSPGALADSILCIHFAYVLCVLAPVPVIITGGCLRWAFVRNAFFRYTHLAMVGFVVLFALMGDLCPLTVLEQQYRLEAGDGAYTGSFIGHWLSRILYYEIDLWIFAVIYVLFGIMVLSLFYFIPVQRSHSKQGRFILPKY